MTRDAKTITHANSNSKTHILGIHEYYSKKGVKYWVVSWKYNGKAHAKSFSCKKYGESFALSEALEFRKLIEEKLYLKSSVHQNCGNIAVD